MIRLFFTTVIFAITISGIAQDDFPCHEPTKKARKLFYAAIETKNPKERMELMLEAKKQDEDFIEPLDYIAEYYEKQAQKALHPDAYTRNIHVAVKYWTTIVEKCPSFRHYLFAMKLGEYYYQQLKFEESKKYFNIVAHASDATKKDERFAVSRIQEIDNFLELKNNPVPFNPKKVPGVCTQWDEYLPSLSPDNRYLFFTRREIVQNLDDFTGPKWQERFIQSRKIRRDSFSRGIPMPKPFNQGLNQGGASISVDNKMIFITIVQNEIGCYKDIPSMRSHGYANGDIYFTEFKNGEWTPLKSIGSNINGKCTWEGQPSISADNKTLYFARASEPDGKTNYGGMDLYKVNRLPDGSWSDPINLGPEINTPGNEKSPFMHSDSYTLYFASDGRLGFGGYDIYYTKMKDNGKFETPKNLGYPINTEQDEHGFIVSKDGHKGYFSSKEDGTNLELYYFDLYPEARPEKVVFVEGEIKDQDGNVPEGAQVLLKNTKTDKEIEAVIDEESGKYVAVIAVGDEPDEDIMLTAKKKGYAFTSQLITSDEIVTGKPIKTKPTEIKPIEVGESYTINDIHFETNSYQLDKRAMEVLNEFIEFLEMNPTVKIAIHGHTDNVGDPQENLILSENRAKAVYQYLILEGIDPSRLQYKGFGDTKPIVSNNTEEGRAKNRRTEFVITAK
tara:strand:- start:7583 stop:9604 length:2022 start_codon:yes stop_codon:yes gene_type:complete